jgi:hypothetical protein
MVIGLPAGRALVTLCALAILETLQARAQVVTKSAPALLSLPIFIPISLGVSRSLYSIVLVAVSESPFLES